MANEATQSPVISDEVLNYLSEAKDISEFETRVNQLIDSTLPTSVAPVPTSLGPGAYFGAFRADKLVWAAKTISDNIRPPADPVTFSAVSTKIASNRVDIINQMFLQRIGIGIGKTAKVSDEPNEFAQHGFDATALLSVLATMVAAWRVQKETAAFKTTLLSRYGSELNIPADWTDTDTATFRKNIENSSSMASIQKAVNGLQERKYKPIAEKTDEDIAYYGQLKTAVESELHDLYNDVERAISDLDKARERADTLARQALLYPNDAPSQSRAELAKVALHNAEVEFDAVTHDVDVAEYRQRELDSRLTALNAKKVADQAAFETSKNIFTTDADLAKSLATGVRTQRFGTIADSIGSGINVVGLIVQSIFADKNPATATVAGKVGLAGALSQHTLDAVTRVLASVGKAPKVGAAAGVGAGIGGGVASGAQLAGLVAQLDDPKLTDEQKKYVKAEIGIQSLAMGSSALSSALGVAQTVIKSASFASAAAKAVPILGAVTSVLTAINPAQWAEFQAREEYNSGVRAREDYSSTRLANLLDKALVVDKGIYGASTAVSAATGVIAAGLALGGVTAGVGALVGLIGGVISGILQAINQVALEAEAAKVRDSIVQEFGTLQKYFEGSFDFQQNKVREGLAQYFDKLLKTGGGNFDSAVAIGTQYLSASDLELANTIKARTELGDTAKHFNDQYLAGKTWVSHQADPAKDIIEVNGDGNDGRAGEKLFVTFSTPLGTDAYESRSYSELGKNEGITQLRLFDVNGWKINEGASDTTFDLKNVISRYQTSSSSEFKDIALKVNAGAGNDVAFIGNSKLEIDGGSGDDTASYSGFVGSAAFQSANRGLTVAVTDSAGLMVRVQKSAPDDYYQEQISTYKTTYGKRTESTQYRNIALMHDGAKDNRLLEDSITGVETFQGSRLNDDLNFLGSREVVNIIGFDGDDRITPGYATKFIAAGSGNDTAKLTDDLYARLSGKTLTDPQAQAKDFLVVDGEGGQDLLNLSADWANAVWENGKYRDTGATLASLAQANQGQSTPAEAGAAVGQVFDKILENPNAKVFDRVVVNNVETVHVNAKDFSAAMSRELIRDGVLDLQDWRRAVSLSFQSRLPGSTVGFDDIRASISLAGLRATNALGKGYTVIGTERTDYITGSDYDDILMGGEGRNELDGGRGNDILMRSTNGDSTYIFRGLSFGHDSIVAPSALGGEAQGIRRFDTFKFDSVKKSDLKFSHAGGDLVIQFKTNDIAITYKNYFDLQDAPDLVFDLKPFLGYGGTNFMLTASQASQLTGAYGAQNALGSEYLSLKGDNLGRKYDLTTAEKIGDIFDESRTIFTTGQSTSWDYAAPSEERSSGGYVGSWVFGSDRAQTLTGGKGNDVIDGRFGADILDGGDGFDIANYGTETNRVVFDLNVGSNGLQSVQLAAQPGASNPADVVKNFEGVMGGKGNDSLKGDAGANYLSGGTGNDEISGGGGDDLIHGGAGLDTLDGGTGFDIASYKGADYAISFDMNTVNGAQTERYFYGGNWLAGDSVKNFEGVIGSWFDDEIKGDDRSNLLIGNLGNDTLTGRGGEDFFKFEGNFGSDRITDFDKFNDYLVFVDRKPSDVRMALSGNQAVVTVGNNSITLVGVASIADLDRRLLFA